MAEPPSRDRRRRAMTTIRGTHPAGRQALCLAVSSVLALTGCGMQPAEGSGAGALPQDRLVIEVRHFGPAGGTDYETAYEGALREGQLITVEITGDDLELLVTEVTAHAVHLEMSLELAVNDPQTGASSEELQQELSLTTAHPTAHLWTPYLDSGSDVILTWTPADIPASLPAAAPDPFPGNRTAAVAVAGP